MKNDYPHPTVWPPPPITPRQNQPVPPKPKNVTLWQKVFGAFSVFCTLVGGLGTLLIVPTYVRGSRVAPKVEAYHQFLAILWDLSQLLAFLGLILGLIGWRSLFGKIGVIFFVALVVAISTESLLSYWQVYGHP